MKKMCVSLFLIVQSCYLIPCTFNSDLDVINEKITIENLSGIYNVEKRTIDYVEGYENNNAFIELKPDGKLIYSNITNRTISFSLVDTLSLTEGEGNWELNNDEISIAFKGISSSWELFKKNDDYVISLLYGDPDECLFTRFIKQTK